MNESHPTRCQSQYPLGAYVSGDQRPCLHKEGSVSHLGFVREDLKIHWFPHPYSAACCRLLREDVKIPTYKPHTNHKKPSVSSYTLAPTTSCDLQHSICRSPLTDLGHISSVTYICHPLWFVCGHRKGILTSSLIQ